MKLCATTAYEASLEILHYIWQLDYKYAPLSMRSTSLVFVYFDPYRCKFEFRSTQIPNRKYLIKRYTFLGELEITAIVATKYPFYQILIGATAMRKLLSYKDFFDTVRDNPEWFLS